MAANLDDGSRPAAVLPDRKANGTRTEPVDSSQSKKRRHDATANDELEIDLSLPEPPSKKTARKAKKQRVAKSEASDKPTLPDTHAADEPTPSSPSPPSAPTAGRASAKPAPAKRSPFAIWIGNLPYDATPTSLRSFLTTHAPAIRAAHITRVHMPAPAAPSHRMYRHGARPTSRGFAYVDFDGADPLAAALALSEAEFEPGGRRVLVKDARSFEGRPERPAAGAQARRRDAAREAESGVRPRSRRVFVGNLAFDVTKEDLEAHYAHCGEVLDVHMATFEDSGKCKGFAWVTFADESASEAAVKGFVMMDREVNEGEEDGDTKKPAKRKKQRKWFVNKLHGRDLRVEFAEDASYRYKKRFGSEAKSKNKDDRQMDDDGDLVEFKSATIGQTANDRRRVMRKAAKRAMHSIHLAQAQPDSGKASRAIPVAHGTKITFD